MTRMRWIAISALAMAGCPADDAGDNDGGGTETTPTSSTSPSSTSPSATDPSMTDPSATDPTGMTETDSQTDTDDPTGEPGCAAVPGEWAADNWADNVVVEMALSDGLASFTGDDLMRGAENGDVTVESVDDLTGPWDAGDPALSSMIHDGFAPIVTDAFEEFVDVVAEGSSSLMDTAGPTWTPGANGGIWGDDNRGVNEGGIEVRQIIDKGGFSAGGLYYHAAMLTEGDIDEATVDRIAYAWGANEALDPEGELDDGANYSYQQGFHAQMAESLIAAKAYAADPMCEAERDQAIVDFFQAWETSMASRHVFYMAAMALGLAGAATETDFAAALHELNEGIGLMAGFYGMPDPASGPLSGGARMITDTDIEMTLGALDVDINALGDSGTGLFVESLPNFETAQGEAEGVLMDVYGVDEATLAGWRTPTPG